MNIITTKLVRDGNSVAVRIPKTVLKMSGLREDIQMEVKHGQITLRSALKPRSDWKLQIAKTIETNPNAVQIDYELNDWESTISDGLN